MKSHIPDSLRELVIERANFRCEYCLLRRDYQLSFPHEVDHIIAEKHFGETVFLNLAYACFYCNRYKGTDLASTDPMTSRVTPLYHPRIDPWSKHFILDNSIVVPITDVGRATR